MAVYELSFYSQTWRPLKSFGEVSDLWPQQPDDRAIAIRKDVSGLPPMYWSGQRWTTSRPHDLPRGW